MLATSSIKAEMEPWNGELYVSFGSSDARSWREARKYSFISAGGGRWYSLTLTLLSLGDRTWVNIPSVGYVGVGIVQTPVVQTKEFVLNTPQGELSAMEGV
jgi:hypothetical protein